MNRSAPLPHTRKFRQQTRTANARLATAAGVGQDNPTPGSRIAHDVAERSISGRALRATAEKKAVATVHNAADAFVSRQGERGAD
uniref:Uncharacterized protein n=1 Tax=Arundo donax TaxID=35708 RepID=A0A0A9FT03_ARUDO